MLSIGIKNAILFVLVLLIFHFIIKNILLDKETTKTYSKKVQNVIITQESDIAKRVETILEPYTTQVTSSHLIDSSSTPKCLPSTEADLNKEKENLLKFVFGDQLTEGGTSKDLDKFFEDKPSNDSLQCNYDKCKPKDDNHIPLKSSCTMDYQAPPSTDMAIKDKICNTKKNLMIVNEYKDEKPENGGMLFGGLSAFDSYDLEFQQYACESKI